MSSITLFLFLRLWRSCHLSLLGFLMTSNGEFWRFVVGTIFPFASCSSTSLLSTFNFCLFSGYWSTHMAWSNLVSGKGAYQWPLQKILECFWIVIFIPHWDMTSLPHKGTLKSNINGHKLANCPSSPSIFMTLLHCLAKCVPPMPWTGGTKLPWPFNVLQLPVWRPSGGEDDCHIFPCVQLPIKVEVIHTPIKPTPRHQFILAHYLCPIDTRCGIIYWL